MAKFENRRLSKKVLAEDNQTLNGLHEIPTFKPNTDEYSVAALEKARTARDAARAHESAAVTALKLARQGAREIEWDLHNRLIRVKLLVQGQFGENSSEVEKLGLKKRVEHRVPKRKAEAQPPAAPVPVQTAAPPAPATATTIKPAA